MTPEEAKDEAKTAVAHMNRKYQNTDYDVIGTEIIGNVTIFSVGFKGEDGERHVNYATKRGDDKPTPYRSLSEIARALDRELSVRSFLQAKWDGVMLSLLALVFIMERLCQSLLALY